MSVIPIILCGMECDGGRISVAEWERHEFCACYLMLALLSFRLGHFCCICCS